MRWRRPRVVAPEIAEMLERLVELKAKLAAVAALAECVHDTMHSEGTVTEGLVGQVTLGEWQEEPT